MQQVGSGAYLADDFSEGLDERTWRVVRPDPGLEIGVEDGCLRIWGRTTVPARCVTAVSSRWLYPSDSMCLVDMYAPTSMTQPGTYGFGVHLAGRLTGDGAEPVGGSGGADVLFARMAGRVGWFHGDAGDARIPLLGGHPSPALIPAAGDETTTFRTVRVAYTEGGHLLETSVLHGTEWIWVGQTRRLLKTVVAATLQVEAAGAGLALDVRFRNVRLFPHPARHPVRVVLGRGRVERRLRVALSALEARENRLDAVMDEPDTALLSLPGDALFPMSGRMEVFGNGRLLDEQVVEGKGVGGLYPGDVYHALTGVFHI
jgi:hypothetical protein